MHGGHAPALLLAKEIANSANQELMSTLRN
jgi:hypothetical protein